MFDICFVFIKAICISDGESAPNLLLSTKAGKAVNNKPIMVRTKADGGSSSASRKGNIEHILHERIQVLLISLAVYIFLSRNLHTAAVCAVWVSLINVVRLTEVQTVTCTQIERFHKSF